MPKFIHVYTTPKANMSSNQGPFQKESIFTHDFSGDMLVFGGSIILYACVFKYMYKCLYIYIFYIYIYIFVCVCPEKVMDAALYV